MPGRKKSNKADTTNPKAVYDKMAEDTKQEFGCVSRSLEFDILNDRAIRFIEKYYGKERMAQTVAKIKADPLFNKDIEFLWHACGGQPTTAAFVISDQHPDAKGEFTYKVISTTINSANDANPEIGVKNCKLGYANHRPNPTEEIYEDYLQGTETRQGQPTVYQTKPGEYFNNKALADTIRSECIKIFPKTNLGHSFHHLDVPTATEFYNLVNYVIDQAEHHQPKPPQGHKTPHTKKAVHTK